MGVLNTVIVKKDYFSRYCRKAKNRKKMLAINLSRQQIWHCRQKGFEVRWCNPEVQRTQTARVIWVMDQI